MFPWSHMDWGWDWSWGWAWGLPVLIVGVILLGICLIPWFFFLLNLNTLLERVSERNRAMPASHVWLNFIPVFNLGWFIYTVVKVRDSVRAEYAARRWTADGDFGYNVGLAAGILLIGSWLFGAFFGFGLGIAALICWIIYWLKTSDYKNRLAEGTGWDGSGVSAGSPPVAPPVYPGPPAAEPPAPKVEPPSSQPSAGPTNCAACGARYDAGDKFCRVCGLPLP